MWVLRASKRLWWSCVASVARMTGKTRSPSAQLRQAPILGFTSSSRYYYTTRDSIMRSISDPGRLSGVIDTVGRSIHAPESCSSLRRVLPVQRPLAARNRKEEPTSTPQRKRREVASDVWLFHFSVPKIYS